MQTIRLKVTKQVIPPHLCVLSSDLARPRYRGPKTLLFCPATLFVKYLITRDQLLTKRKVLYLHDSALMSFQKLRYLRDPHIPDSYN